MSDDLLEVSASPSAFECPAGLQASKRKDMGACQAAIAAAQAAGVEMCEVEKHELNLASGDRPHQACGAHSCRRAAGFCTQPCQRQTERTCQHCQESSRRHITVQRACLRVLLFVKGLVLDCEPLKMETLNALPRPRMQPGQSWPLWLALDEIQDPVSRSAFFLCMTVTSLWPSTLCFFRACYTMSIQLLWLPDLPDVTVIHCCTPGLHLVQRGPCQS